LKEDTIVGGGKEFCRLLEVSALVFSGCKVRHCGVNAMLATCVQMVLGGVAGVDGCDDLNWERVIDPEPLMNCFSGLSCEMGGVVNAVEADGVGDYCVFAWGENCVEGILLPLAVACVSKDTVLDYLDTRHWYAWLGLIGM